MALAALPSSSSPTRAPAATSSSSSSLSSMTCASKKPERQPSAENIAHFARFGNDTFIRAALCNFPVLERLSVVHRRYQSSRVFVDDAVITVESINTLIGKKQLIVLVKNFQLPATTCSTPVAAVVVLTKNTNVNCSHENDEIGHILYCHPRRVNWAVAAIYPRLVTLPACGMETTLCVVRDYTPSHSVFGLIDCGSDVVINATADSLLFVSSVLRSCPFPKPSSASCLSNIRTSLASTQFIPTPWTYVTWSTYNAACRKIEKDVAELPTNTSVSYLCPPVSRFIESVMVVTFLPLDTVERIRDYCGCWWW